MCYQAISVSRQAALDIMRNDVSNVMMVDSFKGAPANMRMFDCFNPFRIWPEPIIPVPGQPGLLARSVESVWQGLKCVDGACDFEQFLTSPSKRPGDDVRCRLADYRYADSQFVYGDRVLDLLSARFLIYLPTYLFMLERLVPETLLRKLYQHIANEGPVIFYDWDANQYITDSSDSFSHSALLASWFNGTLKTDYRALAHSTLQGDDMREFNAILDRLLGRYSSLHGEKP